MGGGYDTCEDSDPNSCSPTSKGKHVYVLDANDGTLLKTFDTDRPVVADIFTVPDPASTIRACASLVKPGGKVFFSTLNRNLKAYLLAVVGAEYVLNLLPKGTHEYAKFIKPSELSRYVREAGLDVEELRGMSYNPLTKIYALGRDTDVNYLMCTSRNA